MEPWNYKGLKVEAEGSRWVRAGAKAPGKGFGGVQADSHQEAGPGKGFGGVQTEKPALWRALEGKSALT